MKSKVAENRSRVIQAESQVPLAMAQAFRAGNFLGHGEAGNGQK